MEIDPQIKTNLSFKEKEELDEISKHLNQLEQPKEPPTAFILYRDQQLDKTQQSVKFEMDDVRMRKQWETLSAAEKSQYESEASALYDKYQREFEETNMLSDQLWTKMQRIKARGDLETRTQVKRVSPYRIYKRETAAQIKSEYPAMSNEERSQIVKERWHTISDRLKAVYVALARLEEEKLAWDAIQDFYKERIDTMRDHACM